MDLSDLSSAGSDTNPFGDPTSTSPSVPLHLILTLNITYVMPGILALEEFHGLHQNDLSITDYFTRLQTLADTLFDCAMPVTDRGLVSNMLCGLSNKFAHAISTMMYDDSKLPTFLQARTYLLQEERRIDHAASHESAIALYAGPCVYTH
ncbi:hypothetical protein ZWY2020_005730 [Hordeum vulgare]|nr:hypothetical protein ZWY2020_005730 [Hordeum vulgare]